MIVVTGSIEARTEVFAELERLAIEHVHRSRGEDGCLSHDVHIHAECQQRLVFVERWRDRGALLKHFADHHAREFAKNARRLAVAPPTIEIYDATDVTLELLSPATAFEGRPQTLLKREP